MSEIANKTILELTPLNGYQENDAIPVQRPNLHEDNCITLGNIIWYDKNAKQLIINGRYRFDMSTLIQSNLSIKLLGDSGINNFTYNGQTYLKNSSIESSEDQLTATITANVDSHYTFNKWQFNEQDISTFHTPDSPNVLNYTFTTGGELSASTTPRQYTITVNTVTPSYGTVSGNGNYNYGQSCTITATANSGYKFVRWTKNGSQVSTNPSYSFTVTENATYTAVFEVEGPPDYYIGLTTNPTNLANMSNSDIISNAEGRQSSTTPIYPNSNDYCYFTSINKLMYVVINSNINADNIKIDIQHEGDQWDQNNQAFLSTFSFVKNITYNNETFAVYATYDPDVETTDGYRIKF